MTNTSVQFYKDYGYLVVKNFLSQHEALCEGELMKKAREKQLEESGSYFRDVQVLSAFSQFEAYPHMLKRYRPQIAELLGIPTLAEVNSYARIYERGAVLEKHKDRFKLQHNATICLTQDNHSWQFCLVDLKGNTIRLTQSVGDALLYYGRLEHWREGPYPGEEQTQVFLHYYDVRSSVKLSILTAQVRLRRRVYARICSLKRKFLPN